MLTSDLRKLTVWTQNQLILVLMLNSDFNFWCENIIILPNISNEKK